MPGGDDDGQFDVPRRSVSMSRETSVPALAEMPSSTEPFGSEGCPWFATTPCGAFRDLGSNRNEIAPRDRLTQANCSRSCPVGHGVVGRRNG